MPPRFRLLAAIVAALLVAGAACSSDDATVVRGEDPATSTTSPISPEVTGPSDPLPTDWTPATQGDLVAWSMTAGECSNCGFDLRLAADGTATYRPDLGRASATFDPAELRVLLDDLDPSALVASVTDCGREVDGNAPSLTLFRDAAEPLVIDDCYTEIDRDHPLMVFILDVLADAEASVQPLLAQVVIYGGLCPDGACRTEYAVYADGSWTKSDESGRSFDGGLIHEEKKRLHSALAGVTLDDLVVGPFTGECPTAVDGQARTYVVYPDAVPIDGLRADEEPRPVTVDTCRDELRADAPAIVALDDLVASTSGG